MKRRDFLKALAAPLVVQPPVLHGGDSDNGDKCVAVIQGREYAISEGAVHKGVRHLGPEMNYAHDRETVAVDQWATISVMCPPVELGEKVEIVFVRGLDRLGVFSGKVSGFTYKPGSHVEIQLSAPEKFVEIDTISVETYPQWSGTGPGSAGADMSRTSTKPLLSNEGAA